MSKHVHDPETIKDWHDPAAPGAVSSKEVRLLKCKTCGGYLEEQRDNPAASDPVS